MKKQGKVEAILWAIAAGCFLITAILRFANGENGGTYLSLSVCFAVFAALSTGQKK